MTVWIGPIGVTVYSDKENYMKNLRKRFCGYVDDSQGQINIEIVETNFKPEITKQDDQVFWFTMFSGNVYVYIEYSTWSGKIYICEDTPVRYDALDTVLVMIAAHFLPLFGSILVHGCCVDYKGVGVCFMGESGAGKSTLAKILSSDYQIIAEDMLCLSCYENKVVASSIPLGQKQFWVENAKLELNSICFVREGELGIDSQKNRLEIAEIILRNQFYKAKPNEIMIMDSMRFNINRMFSNVSFYDFYWEAERFYKKDREYIKDVKNMLACLEKLAPSGTKTEITKRFILNEYLCTRENINSNKLEVWDASVHRLYGVTGMAKYILDYAKKNPQFTIEQLKKALKRAGGIEDKDMMTVLNELVSKNILLGGYKSDE